MIKGKRADLAAGLGLVAVAVYVYFEASAMPGARRGLGPGGYPMFVAVGLAILGLALAVQSFIGAAAEKSGGYTAGKFLRFVVFVALCLAYAYALRPFGFILSSIAFLIAAVNFFGYKKHWLTVAFSVGTTLVTYAVFRHVFLVLLPTGSIFQ